MMEMTCHPRLGGARPKGGRGSSPSSAYLAILFILLYQRKLSKGYRPAWISATIL